MKLKRTARQSSRSIPSLQVKYTFFKASFPSTLLKEVFSHSVKCLMFLLHRAQGSGVELCNALGRNSHMVLFRKLSSHTAYQIMKISSPGTSFFTDRELHLAFYQLFPTLYRSREKNRLCILRHLVLTGQRKNSVLTKSQKHTPTKNMTGEKSYISQKSQIQFLLTKAGGISDLSLPVNMSLQ